MKGSSVAVGFLIVLLSVISCWGQDPNWPQWRGPGGHGISSETNLPWRWGEKENIRWKTAIPGRGHSSPIVWGNKIFLTTSIQGEEIPGVKAPVHYMGNEEFVHPDSEGVNYRHTLRVLCIDRNTGKILWDRTAYDGPVYDNRLRKNTYASSTPVTDGKQVFVFFGTEGLYSYDLEGGLVWKNSLGKLPNMGIGPGISPVLYENLIILQNDLEWGDGGSFIAAVDKTTGKEVWRVARQARASWSTPLLVEHEGHVQLVASGAETVIAYEPDTGKELWRCEGLVSHAIPSAVSGFDMVFVTAGSQAKRAMAIQLGGSGDLTGSSHIVWRYQKGTAYVPSPILYGDYLYLMTDKGLITCLEARTGKVLYEGGRVPVPAVFTASPVAFDGKIFLSSEDGDTFILKAGPEHEILGTNSIGEPIYASPAIAFGSLYIRGEKHLFCIGPDPAQ